MKMSVRTTLETTPAETHLIYQVKIYVGIVTKENNSKMMNFLINRLAQSDQYALEGVSVQKQPVGVYIERDFAIDDDITQWVEKVVKQSYESLSKSWRIWQRVEELSKNFELDYLIPLDLEVENLDPKDYLVRK